MKKGRKGGTTGGIRRKKEKRKPFFVSFQCSLIGSDCFLTNFKDFLGFHIVPDSLDYENIYILFYLIHNQFCPISPLVGCKLLKGKQRDRLLAYILSCLDITIDSVAVPYMTTSLIVIILMAFFKTFERRKGDGIVIKVYEQKNSYMSTFPIYYSKQEAEL